MLRAKAQMKVALLTALETPGGRIERMARQLLSWNRIVPSEEIVAKVDALTADQIHQAGRKVLQGEPTIAAIGPIKGLPRREKSAPRCGPEPAPGHLRWRSPQSRRKRIPLPVPQARSSVLADKSGQFRDRLALRASRPIPIPFQPCGSDERRKRCGSSLSP